MATNHEEGGGRHAVARTATVPLEEERLVVSRRQVETGRVRVRVLTDIEEAHVREELRREALDVQRVPVGRELAEGEAVPVPHEEEDGAVLVVPVIEEVLVVEKRLLLTEELRIRRTVVTEPAEQTLELRRQRAELERLPPATPGEEEAVSAGG